MLIKIALALKEAAQSQHVRTLALLPPRASENRGYDVMQLH